MPPTLPALYELQLTITGPDKARYKFGYRLLHHRAYPPPPRREQDRIVFDDDVRELGKGDATEDATLLQNLVLGAGLSRINSQGQPELPVGPIPEASYRPIDQVTRALFQGEGMSMLKFMLEGATMMDNDPSSQPAKLGRITLYIENPELRKVRWELLGILSAGEWVELGRLIMLRRHGARAGELSASLDLPVNVAIKSYTDRLGSELVGDYGERMFDEFTRDARDAGGIVWGGMTGGSQHAEVHHIVFDMDDSRGWRRLLSYADGMKPQDDLTETTDAKLTVPRLLVLHNLSPLKPDYDIYPFLTGALERGVDAVLLATLPTPQSDAGRFFSTYYRKLMHNWPLDQCLLAARLEARKNGVTVDTVFAAREEGELSLLLSRAIIESVAPQVKSAGAEPPAKRPPKRQTRGVTFGSRLAGQTRQAVSGERELIAEASSQAAELEFDEELHGVREAVRVRDAMRGAIRTVESAAEVEAKLTEVAPEDTVRLTNLWLVDRGAEQRTVARNEPLVVGKKYDLHLQIGQRRIEALVAEAFPDEKLQEIFKTEDSVTLDVMFFAPKADFEFESRAEKMKLPKFGNSDDVSVSVVPLLSGARRIRACIYYQNTMLQSIVLETRVVETGDELSRGEEKPVTEAVIDYVAITDLSVQCELPSPVVNLFTNQAPDGTHWIGIFSSGATANTDLRSGDMHTFTAGRLKTVAEQMRTCLLQIEGADSDVGYRYRSPVPDEDEMAEREADLCTLAHQGWLLYQSLFQGDEQPLPVDRQKTFKEELTKQGSIISVARCRGESVTIPWASLYTLRLDTNKRDKTTVCGIFRDQLKANQWSADQTKLVAKHDLLDDPVACRSQEGCPLGDDKKRRVTVCPFGFWGFLHQIEQPLQHVTPTPSDKIPPEMKDPKIQTSFLSLPPDEDLKLVCAVYSPLEGAEEHRAEIKKIEFKTIKVDDTENRDHVLEVLEEGGPHVYYFYCHGEMENNRFRLKLGLEDDAQYLGAADLDVTEIDWSDKPMPLVIINGCDTMAVLPEQIHDFLSVLKQLGASGVIGTEVKVWTTLARPFGSMVLNYILAGKSVGETFLEIRKNMLRRYNPLGLLYNYYSPANLHLHKPADCDWCATHKQAVAGGN